MKKSILIVLLLIVTASVFAFYYRAYHNTPTVSLVTHTIVSAKANTNQKWIGDWERADMFEPAGVNITKISRDSFYFELNAQNGGHTGQIEGRAAIKNNVAFFKSDEDKKCKLVFRLLGDSVIVIDDKDYSCQNFGGIGVGFSGRFKNTKLLPKGNKDKPTEDMLSLGILNKSEDKAFRDLVGDYYTKFVYSSQLQEDNLDHDGLKTKVVSSGVRGLFTYMENIVMIDSVKTIYTALLDDEKVYYFTNNKSYADKLPKTIEDWRSRFKDYPVIYKSK